MKIKKMVFFIPLFIGVASATLSFFSIKTFTRRPRYSKERIIEHTEAGKILRELHNAQPCTFTTEDNLKLAGLLITRPQARRTILICHGFRMAKERLLPFTSIFPDDNLFFFDYRAHGDSEGNCVTFGFHERKDVLAAVHFLQQTESTHNTPLFAIGISMGAVSLLGAAGECDAFKAIVLDSPFAQLDEEIQRIIVHRYHFPRSLFPKIGRLLFEYQTKISSAEVNALAWIKNIKCPVFFVHSHNDQVAFFNDMKRISEQVPTTCDIWEIDSCQHAYAFKNYPDEYRNRINQFFDQAIA